MTPQYSGSANSTHAIGSPLVERTPTLETVALSPGTVSEFAEPLHHVHPTFGDFELLHVAGEGGMGVVYQARHRFSDRICALKTMKANASFSPELAVRFQREIRTADSVRHANIVPVLDAGEIDGRCFYTMPFAPTNLGRQRHQFRDPRAAAVLGVKIARALHFAHSQGIIHRDLKPANILLDTNGEPLIADFGLARWVEASQILSNSIEHMGTPAYMAPEQASGPSCELSGAADIWSLGIILYELLTGQRPFDAPNPNAMIYQIRSSSAPPLRAFRPELDAALESIILTCLSKDRAGRYVTAGALADDLERWLDGKPIRAQAAPTATIAAPRPALSGMAPRTKSLAFFALAIGGLLTWGAAAMLNDTIGAEQPVGEDPESMREAQERLKSGQSVELIANGKPLYSKLLHGFANDCVVGREATTKDMVLSSHQTAFVSMIPDVPLKSWRIDAQMRMDSAKRDGSYAGVVFGWDDRTIGEQPFHAVVLWHWNDLVAESDANPEDLRTHAGNKPEMKMLMYVGQKVMGNAIVSSEKRVPRFVPAFKTPMRKAWRRIIVDVTPTAIRASIDGAASWYTTTPAAISYWIGQHLAIRTPHPAEPWLFQPGGAAGLAVQDARVTVRSFSIHSLRE